MSDINVAFQSHIVSDDETDVCTDEEGSVKQADKLRLGE